MFSGIVETIGIIVFSKKLRDCISLTISPNVELSDICIGDSISINGVCLTVTNLIQGSFDVLLTPQTLRLINHGQLNEGCFVNLERAIKATGRIGGHYVQGHIDTVSKIIAIKDDGKYSLVLTMSLSRNLTKYVVNKGYVALDGMSLTIVDTNLDSFTVVLIPHTRRNTIAKQYRLDEYVNVEVDIFGKYVEKMLRSHQ